MRVRVGGSPTKSGVERYSLFGLKPARVARVTQSSAPTSTTTLYLYDLSDHIIAEMDTSGQTLKEYIWLDDMPVAVVDGVNTATPTIYYVHVDHLMRPIRMTAQDWTWVWDVTYAPFGATTNLYTNPEVMNGRFPGQWFQLETGLAYNWHRHYDPTTGRYIQPDPLLSDESGATVAGLPVGTITVAADGHAAARSMGWQEAHDIIMSWPSPPAMLQDGPSIYGYAGLNPFANVDQLGLSSFDDGIHYSVCLLGFPCVGHPETACMARNESGQKNFLYFEAKSQPNPCDFLDQEYKSARANGDAQRAQAIIQAQKALGCRNKQKRGR